MAHSIVDAPEPLPAGRSGGLGHKIEQTLERVLSWALNACRDTIIGIGAGALELFADMLKPVLLSAYRPMLEKVRAQEGLPDELKVLLDTTLRAEGEAGAALLLQVGSSASAPFIGGIMGVITRPLVYMLQHFMTIARPEPATAMVLGYRVPELWQRLDSFLGDQGWSTDMIDAFHQTSLQRLGAAEMIAAGWRGFVNQAQVDDELSRQGWGDSERSLLYDLLKPLPGPGDLVTMAVREAFSPEQVAALGLAAEFPAAFGEWMTKQGYDIEWAQRFWYSHWALPSISMAFEMLHRGVLDESGLDALLKAQDISPAWRDKLTEISYNPLTRVDVRRMYGLGVLDRSDVLQSYRDIGYNEINAERMTEFTVLYESEDVREATKADILRGYREGMLTEQETVGWLVEINYSQEIASYLVAQETAKRERALTDEQIGLIKTLFIGGDLTEPEARTRLTALALTSSEIDVKLASWSVTRASKINRPTQSQLTRMLERDIITDTDYRDAVGELGYKAPFVDWYVTLALDDKADKARVAEERARTEQEAIRGRKIKSDYQVAKAALDVDTTELQTAIAETQVAIRARKTRYDEELHIVRQALTAAELEDQTQTDIDLLNADIGGARDSQAALREQVDQAQTEIARIRLQVTEYKDAARVALLSAVSPEEAVQIKQDADAAGVEFERQQRVLAVRIEEYQDEIAAFSTMITDLQRQIAERRARLFRDLDIISRLTSETELTATYESDTASMQGELEGMRINLLELKESKARLAVGYREGLAGG